MNLSQTPNIISIARILLVAPIAYLLFSERYTEAVVLFVIAGVSDGIDGYLAKHYNWTSRLGSILDPLADKLLLVTTFIVLGWMGHIPLWVVAAVIARDVIIMIGAIAYHFLIGAYHMAPTIFSKINTAVQITLATAILFSLAIIPLSPELLTVLVYGVFVTTVVSGVDYVWSWSKRAIQVRGHRHCR